MDVTLAAPPTLNECGPKKAALSPTARAPALTAADTEAVATKEERVDRVQRAAGDGMTEGGDDAVRASGGDEADRTAPIVGVGLAVPHGDDGGGDASGGAKLHIAHPQSTVDVEAADSLCGKLGAPHQAHVAQQEAGEQPPLASPTCVVTSCADECGAGGKPAVARTPDILLLCGADELAESRRAVKRDAKDSVDAVDAVPHVRGEGGRLDGVGREVAGVDVGGQQPACELPQHPRAQVVLQHGGEGDDAGEGGAAESATEALESVEAGGTRESMLAGGRDNSSKLFHHALRRGAGAAGSGTRDCDVVKLLDRPSAAAFSRPAR